MVFSNNFSVKTKGYNDIVNITDSVMDVVKSSLISNGNVLVFCPGSTCGITTTEFESGAVQDLREFYERLIPEDEEYKHNLRWDDGNGFSHLRAAIMKSFFSFPVINGTAILGTWQQIILVDFDNRSRSRNIVVQIVGE
ncbi:MAG: secondary thiamine-phosphate synthase enzyme YjbQ [Bacteroidetes bacterium]|nr:secondary thiamine-phosphate synthase enzyme YjbQ [Bacteroidota bacterium]